MNRKRFSIYDVTADEFRHLFKKAIYEIAINWLYENDLYKEDRLFSQVISRRITDEFMDKLDDKGVFKYRVIREVPIKLATDE